MTNEPKQSVARVLTLGLGATTAMWVFLYIAFLFSGNIGAEILFIFGALCLPLASRHANSIKEGAWVGVVSALLNMLLIGSVVGGQAPSAMLATGFLWIASIFICSIVLGVIGSLFHYQLRDRSCIPNWHHRFLVVATALVFLMLITGGLVTGKEVGLAVPDWPNSFGYNMLLYPLAEMIASDNDGVFYEHAHRLMGMFVGLTSIIMLVCVWCWDSRQTTRVLAIFILLLVCLQGLIGGLRVTGVFTFAQDREVLDPNPWMGVIHGVVGQLIFALLACLATMFSQTWIACTRARKRGDLRWTLLLCISMIIQLALGAVYRHMMDDEAFAPKATHILYTHIAFAVLVLVFAIVVGIRYMDRENRSLQRIGLSLHILVLLQLLLGGGALFVMIVSNGDTSAPLYEVIVTTMHQANGALLLAVSFVALAWAMHMKKVEPAA